MAPEGTSEPHDRAPPDLAHSDSVPKPSRPDQPCRPHTAPLATPRRLLDTRRTGRANVLTVRVPGGHTAAAVNLTVTRAAAAGYLAAGPCRGEASGDDETSNVNFGAGDTIAAAAFVPLGDDDTFCVITTASADVIVDLTGTLADDGALAFVPARPGRVLDTRDGHGGWGPVHGVGDVLDVRAAPPGASAMTGTVTIVRPAQRGFVSAAPCGTEPEVSTVNAAPVDVVANSVTVGLDASQRVCLTASATGHTLLDVTGWWVP